MALSEQWRVQRSTIPAVELANAIRGLGKVIGSISPATELLAFGGMSFNQNIVDEARRIVIDRDYALKHNTFPIPPEDFDVLVGLAAHEAAHTATDAVAGSLGGNEAKSITSEEFVAVCEEIYTDNYVRRHFPVHYNYIIMARKAYGEDAKVGGKRPDLNNINSVAIAKYVYGEQIGPGDVAPEHLQVHMLLDMVNITLSNKDMDAVERKSYYRIQYEAIKGMLGTDAIALKKSLTKSVLQDDVPKSLRRRYKKSEHNVSSGLDEMGLPDSEMDEDTVTGDGDTDPMHKPEPMTVQEENEILKDMRAREEDLGVAPENLTPEPDKELEDLLEEVTQSLRTNKEDMSEELMTIVMDADAINDSRKDQYKRSSEHYPITYANSENQPLDRNENHSLLRDLDWIKRIKNTILRRNIRAQAEGTLDKRRLHRHLTDGLVYKKRHIMEKQELDLVLLMDSSGSMNGVQGKIVYEAAHALYTVISDSHVLAYDSSMNEIRIRDHSWDKRMRLVRPGGNTPSGKALLATATKYPKSLIIHFTDGASNTDLAPKDAMLIIKDKFPKVQITNIVVGKIAGYGSLPDNATIVELKTLEEFPEALKKTVEPWYRTR